MPSNEVLRQRAQNLAQFANSHRLLLYSFVSILALGAVVTNALKNYSNFYSVAIYLSKSSRSVLALANFAILVTLLFGHLVQRIFFGTLRANEVERLYDRLWFFITESLLAFTIFRDEFDASFAFMFGFLLFIKSFHWLASDRIEWMDQRPYPGPPLLFHVRMIVLFAILWSIDTMMFLFTVEHTLSIGVDGMVLFASEYGILIASVMNTIAKYALSAYELRRAGQRGGENAPPWENKSMWVFYIELATDFLKLSIYLLFFTIIITFYGLPLNIVRDVYITARSFVTRLRALHRYQTATRNMDQRYPNATEEELSAMSDRTCIICREEMVFHAPGAATENRDGPNMSPKKLPCGHIFHFYCLRSWLERQQSCPTCRRTVLDENIPPNPRANNPPPPAPGAVPQPPNGNDAPVQQGPNAFGNPLGFANRFFGPPGQQDANVPAAVANPGGQNPGVPNGGQGAPPQNPPMLIHYDLQYQPQFGQLNFPQQFPGQYQGGQPLTPVPTFPGFQGVAGAQQPTPTPASGQPQAPHSTTPTSSSAGTSSQSHLPPPATTTTQSSSTSSYLTDSDSDSSSDGEETLSPRDAARAAALRRFGGATSTPTPTRTIPESPPTATVSTSTEVPALSSAPAAVPQPQQPTPELPYPRLIPVYDLEGTASQQPSQYPTGRNHYFAQPPSGNPLTGIPPGLQTPFTPNPFGHVMPGPYSAPPSPYAQFNRPSGPLTEEELRRMDSLTREAIDERLRVLERVSTNLYGCMDDLMRMRSALPELPSVGASEGATGGVHMASTSQSQDQGSSTAISTRQAEKRPERRGISDQDGEGQSQVASD